MTTELRSTVERAFDAVMKMDIDAVLPYFADACVLIDPHYPTPRMVGKAAIRDGLAWGFGAMQKMGFTITTYFEADNHTSAVIEVDTAHVLKQGMRLNFPQIFVIETKDGLITRMQAYEPYGPHGINGFVLSLTRLSRKLSGKG